MTRSLSPGITTYSAHEVRRYAVVLSLVATLVAILRFASPVAASGLHLSQRIHTYKPDVTIPCGGTVKTRRLIDNPTLTADAPTLVILGVTVYKVGAGRNGTDAKVWEERDRYRYAAVDTTLPSWVDQPFDLTGPGEYRFEATVGAEGIEDACTVNVL